MAALVEQIIYRNKPEAAKRFKKNPKPNPNQNHPPPFLKNILNIFNSIFTFLEEKNTHKHHLLYIISSYNQVKQYYYALP